MTYRSSSIHAATLALTLATSACTGAAENAVGSLDGFVDVGLSPETASETRADSSAEATTDASATDAAGEAGPADPIVGRAIATGPTDGVVCKGVTCPSGTDCCDGVAGAVCISKAADCIAPPAWCSGRGGATATCPAPRAACDGNEDCKTGEVCCIDAKSFSTSCQSAAACKANSRVCHDTVDCVAGEHCCALLYPFPTSGLCQPTTCTSGLSIGGSHESDPLPGVPCGDKRCAICCDARAGAGASPYQCVDAVTSCKRQVNTCDGPEDCKVGDECCIDYRGFGACKTKGTCDGTRVAVACHTKADCGEKQSCCSFSGVGVCESVCR